MKTALHLTLLCLYLSGCVIIENLDEISVLRDYSRNKEDQHHLVKSINDHYDALTRAIAKGRISDYKDETMFVYSFGEPIFKQNLGDGGQRWLYRYAIYKSARDKVYAYFDRNGKMIKWEKLPCPKFF